MGEWVCSQKSCGDSKGSSVMSQWENLCSLVERRLSGGLTASKRIFERLQRNQFLSTVLKSREQSLLRFNFKVVIEVWCFSQPINLDKASRGHVEIKTLPATVLKLKLARHALGMLEMRLLVGYLGTCSSACGWSHGNGMKIKYQRY